jgi:hypothetical protein
MGASTTRLRLLRAQLISGIDEVSESAGMKAILAKLAEAAVRSIQESACLYYASQTCLLLSTTILVSFEYRPF